MNQKGAIRMKKIGLVVFALLLLVGCGNKGQESYEAAMEKGVESVVAKEYAKGEASFELALESKKEDKKATVYLNQVKKYVQAKKEFESKDYLGAKKSIQEVTKAKDGLKEILTVAEKLEKEIDDVQKDISENDGKLSEAKKYQESNAILDPLLGKNLDRMANDFKIKCEELKKKNDSALEEESQQVKEKEAKEAAEASAQTPAKLISNKDDAFNYIQVKMPQAGKLTYISYEGGLYHFSSESGLAEWHISVDEAGNLTEEVVKDLSPLASSDTDG